ERLRLPGGRRAEVVPQARPQRLVDEERLGAVPLALERLHQQPVTGLAVRLERDEAARRADGGGKLGSADAERRCRVRLECARVQPGEAAALLLDPRRVLAGEERA